MATAAAKSSAARARSSMATTNAKSGARKHRRHGATVRIATIAAIVLFGSGPCLRPACPGHRPRARSCAITAVAGRLGAAVTSTIRVAHLAMAAEAMWKSATEGGEGDFGLEGFRMTADREMRLAPGPSSESLQ